MFAAPVRGFEQGIGEIDAGEILHRRVDRFGRRALHRTDDDIDAAFHPVWRDDAVIRHRPGHEFVIAAAQILQPVGRHAARRDQIDHGIAQPRPAHAFHQNLPHAGAVQRQCGETADADRAFPAVKMKIEPEKPPVADMHRVIGHVGQQEAQIGDRKPHVLLGAIFTIDIANALWIGVRVIVHWRHLSRHIGPVSYIIAGGGACASTKIPGRRRSRRQRRWR